MKKLFLFVLLTSFVSTLKAQDESGSTFSIDMQVRPRFEYRNGYSFPRETSDKASAFISNRARIGLNYSNDLLSTRIAGQEVALWGAKRLTDTEGSFTVNEAWGQIEKNGFFIKLGRQGLHYDEGLILSQADWNQGGKWHDALKLGYQNQNNQIDLVLAHNQSAERTNSGTFYNGKYPYKNMQTVWYHHNSSSGFGASLLFMNLGFECGTAVNANTVYMQTLGTHLSYKASPFNVYGAFYYQMGKNKLQKEVSAYAAQLKSGYSLNSNFTFFLGMDYISGQDPSSTKIAQIDFMNGGMHKFFGAMDYFSTDRYYGLFDKFAVLAWKSKNSLSLELSYFHFSSMQPVLVNGVEKKNLGSEFDFLVAYPFRKYITLQAGYSVMLPTEAMTAYKGYYGNYKAWQDWGFVSVNINPTIFKMKF